MKDWEGLSGSFLYSVCVGVSLMAGSRLRERDSRSEVRSEAGGNCEHRSMT